MKHIIENLEGSDSKYLVYLLLIVLTGLFIIKPILILIFSIPYGGLDGFRSQIFEMCGSTWWSGMDYSNYIFSPSPGDCSSIETTLWIGYPILLGLSAILIGIIRKRVLRIQLQYNLRMTLFYFFGIIVLCSVYRVLVGYQSLPFPDSIIYIISTLTVCFRMFEKQKVH